MSMNQQKKLHFQKTNHHASIRILFLMTLLICNGYQIYLDNTYQIFFILFQGLLLVSLFAPLHECSHSTAFKSKFLKPDRGHEMDHTAKKHDCLVKEFGFECSGMRAFMQRRK